MFQRFTVMLLLCLLNLPASAGQMRFWLAHQENYNAKKGLYFRLQSHWPDGQSGKLADVQLVAGLANGKHWRTASIQPQWQLKHPYTVVMIYDGKHITLKLDDQQARSKQKIKFMPIPDATQLKAGLEPGWAQKGGPCNYQIIQHSIHIKRSGQPDIKSELLKSELTQNNLWLFEPSVMKKIACQFMPGKPFEIRATFSILNLPDIKDLPTLVDRYGQVIDGQWAKKITSNQQLKDSYTDEIKRLSQWPDPENVDDFGGRKTVGFSETPTGFWRVVRRKGVYWLITPQGNPCYYTGICGVPALRFPVTCTDGRENIFAELPPRTGLFAQAWHVQKGKRENKNRSYNTLSWQATNLIRKFGQSWKRDSINLARHRLQKWGFTGIGKWGGFIGAGTGDPDMKAMTCVPVISWANAPMLTDEHPDIFDPKVQKLCEQAIAQQIKPYLNNPYILGWSLTNERRGIIKSHQIVQILGMGKNIAAKRALVDYALDQLYNGNLQKLAASWQIKVNRKDQLANIITMKLPKDDLHKLRLFMADRYHAFIYATFKKLDPNHMYLSHWLVPGWWESEDDWLIPAKYCDIMGYDRYSDELIPDWLLKLMKQSDKPVLCGEYSFPSYNDGQRGHGQFKVSAVNDADAGRKYAANLSTAASNPYCVGQLWFVYRDQPITGRDPAITGKVVQGECFGFGLVDVADQPKWDMLKPIRDANLKAMAIRLKAAKK